MKDILDRLRSPRWPLGLYILVGLVSAALLWWRLGTLLPGWSQPEINARVAANSIHTIIGNPLNLPYKLFQYGFIKLGHHGAFWMRLVSTLVGGLIIVGFYQILRTWYTSRVALLCSFLFLTSAWFLHYARLATPDVLLGSSIALIWLGIRLRSNANRTVTLLAGAAITFTLLYIPGMIWLVGTLLVWQRKALKDDFGRLSKKWRGLLVVGFLAALVPLVHAFVRHPHLLRDWLGLPAMWTPRLWLSNLWHLPVWLVLQGPHMPVYWLGHVPILDVFSVAMLMLGGFVLWRYLSLDRVRAMVVILVVGAVLTVLNGPQWLFFISPVVYLAIAGGVALLLQQWFTVFPRNPLARSLGILMVFAVVVFAAYYNLHAYFIAWPHDPVTKAFFNIHG